MSKSDYIQVDLKLSAELRDTLIALLADAGFSAIEELPEGLRVYSPEHDYDSAGLQKVLDRYFGESSISFTTKRVKGRNWNKEWEENYPPVYIENFCQIVPSFKEPSPGYTYTLIIEPKMSFGTGHHETTQLMISQMRKIDFRNAHVLDMGCGTGILGVLAEKMGAAKITGIDIDEWAVENGPENVHFNHCRKVAILQGNAESIPEKEYDVILANINRNVLLNDVSVYRAHLRSGGTLLISGILEKDESVILNTFTAEGLQAGLREQLQEWLSLSFVKND